MELPWVGEGDVGGTSQAPEASLPTLQAPPPALCMLGQGFHPDLPRSLEPTKGRERPESEGREQREKDTRACSLICKGAESVRKMISTSILPPPPAAVLLFLSSTPLGLPAFSFLPFKGALGQE